VLSEASVNGHTLSLFANDTDDPAVRAEHVVTTTFTPPTGGGTVAFNFNGAQWWDVFTAASWALHHRDGGLPDQDFTLYYQACPVGAGTPCFYVNPDGSDAIYAMTNSRNQTVHELGHAIAWRTMGTANNSPNAVADTCTTNGGFTHEMQQREFNGEAFWEGFANFYAVVTFNRKDQEDCFFEYYKWPNWDLDGDPDPFTTNCAGVPWENELGNPLDTGDTGYSPEVGTKDYLYDSHVDLECSTRTLDNRATELDYVRFFWEMYQQEGMSLAEILGVLTVAGPNSFYQGDDPEDTGAPRTNWPGTRIRHAAKTYDILYSTAWGTLWENAAIAHGVHR
jgi:hypothetical protein